MSLLRYIAIISGIISLLICFLRLRVHAEKRHDVWLLAFFGIALLLIGLFPDLVNFPAELLSLRERPRGRLITLLLLSNALLWFVLIYERSKSRRQYLQLDDLVRNLAVKAFIDQHGGALPPGSAMVLIPAYNEAQNLIQVLRQIPKEIRGIPLRILVIDDGSTDATAEISKQHGAWVAVHPTNSGGGAALKSGYAIIRHFEPRVIVTMDADGQHSPDEIGKLIEPIVENRADMVIGSRILGSSADHSRLRFIGVHFYSALINLIMGTRITDCSSGFRAFSRPVLQECVLQQTQYHTAEIIIEAAKRGMNITERPVHIQPRLSGKSKKGKDLKYGLYFLRTIIKTWWR